jgi:hypothetical protein
MSVRQGEAVSSLIEQGGLVWNRAFGGGSVVVPQTGPLPRIDLEGGMKLTLLSPTVQGLGRLHSHWNLEAMRSGYTPGSAASPEADGLRTAGADTPSEDLETEEQDLQADAEATKQSDETWTRRGAPDVETLANAPFREDLSVANGSSIAFLAEISGRSLLIGGDAFPSVLAGSIKRLLTERGQHRLRVNLFVVPHAGSRNNVSKDFLELLDCRRYVFATSGDLFRHPDMEAVARVVVFGRARPDAALTLFFNYRSRWNELWSSAELQARFRYQAVYPTPGAEGIRVRL